MKRMREDEDAWRNGYYMMSAINKALGGKKAKYLDAPLLESIEEESSEEDMTEAQKKKQRDILLAKLQLMQTNFELNHKDDDGGDEDK